MSVLWSTFPHTIPRVMCPACGVHMRFATFEPIQRDGYKMTFDCRCGFKYQLSDLAAEVLANNEADIRLAPP